MDFLLSCPMMQLKPFHLSVCDEMDILHLAAAREWHVKQTPFVKETDFCVSIMKQFKHKMFS